MTIYMYMCYSLYVVNSRMWFQGPKHNVGKMRYDEVIVRQADDGWGEKRWGSKAVAEKQVS